MAIDGAARIGARGDRVLAEVTRCDGTGAAAGDIDRDITKFVDVIGRIGDRGIAGRRFNVADITAIAELLVRIARIGADMEQVRIGER